MSSIALCSDIGPLLLRSSSVGVSRVPNPPAQCLKQASRGWSNFIDYRSRMEERQESLMDLRTRARPILPASRLRQTSPPVG
jgi:hypothetical protein